MHQHCIAAGRQESPDVPRIPIIDVAPFLGGSPGSLAPLARQIATTSEDTGFLVIANHGVPQALIDRTFAETEKFFALPVEEKLALRIGDYNIGYLPFGGQTVRHSRINHNTKPNYQESFYITRERPADHPDILAKKPHVAPNRWPQALPTFRAAMLDYWSAMEALALRLVPAFAAALGLPTDYFDQDFAEPSCTLRLIRYAPQHSDEENLFGFAPHTDNNFITFLAQSALPGLEVRTREGSWIRPPAVPGTFVVNTGEMLARYSNDRFVPTPHRVINRNDTDRYAIPFFLGPNLDSMVQCVPSCVSPGNPPRYEPTTYSDFIAQLLTLNFAHRQQAPSTAA